MQRKNSASPPLEVQTIGHPASHLELDGFPERLKQIIGTESLRSFGARCGLSEGVLRSYLRENTYPSLDRLAAIAEAAGIGLAWLVTGEHPAGIKDVEGAPSTEQWLDEEYVRLPRYTLGETDGSDQVVDHICFKAGWLKTSLGLLPARAAVICMVGDSMEPYLSDGDLVLLDTGIRRIEFGSVYVLRYGNLLQIKRIQVRLDGTLVIKSDNDAYEPEILRGKERETLQVVGRVVRRMVR